MSLLVGLALGGGFLYVGTQLRGRERAQPLLIASATAAIFFFGRFWASPMNEIFPSAILAALWSIPLQRTNLIVAASVYTNTAHLCLAEYVMDSLNDIYEKKLGPYG